MALSMSSLVEVFKDRDSVLTGLIGVVDIMIRISVLKQISAESNGDDKYRFGR